jgi:hypothetical protein
VRFIMASLQKIGRIVSYFVGVCEEDFLFLPGPRPARSQPSQAREVVAAVA